MISRIVFNQVDQGITSVILIGLSLAEMFVTALSTLGELGADIFFAHAAAQNVTR